jgi:hypothetical protein
MVPNIFYRLLKSTYSKKKKKKVINESSKGIAKKKSCPTTCHEDAWGGRGDIAPPNSPLRH